MLFPEFCDQVEQFGYTVELSRRDELDLSGWDDVDFPGLVDLEPDDLVLAIVEPGDPDIWVTVWPDPPLTLDAWQYAHVPLTGES